MWVRVSRALQDTVNTPSNIETTRCCSPRVSLGHPDVRQAPIHTDSGTPTCLNVSTRKPITTGTLKVCNFTENVTEHEVFASHYVSWIWEKSTASLFLQPLLRGITVWSPFPLWFLHAGQCWPNPTGLLLPVMDDLKLKLLPSLTSSF